MSYFQFLYGSRQAVFYAAILFVFSVFAQISAQETNEIDKNEASRKPIQTVDETDTRAKKDAPKFTAETSPAKTFAVSFKRENQTFRDISFKPENQNFRDFSFSKKVGNKRQSQDDDGKMMGVMGEGAEKSRFGGHVGFVVPIVARGGGVTTNVGDRFTFGFPVGLTVKTRKNLAVDFEFIPTFNTGRDFVFTIHPGIIYGFKKNYAVGVRAAYDAGAGSYGFTPLVSRGFKINEKLGWFIEADFPIRSNYRAYQDRFGSIAFAAHAGIAF